MMQDLLPCLEPDQAARAREIRGRTLAEMLSPMHKRGKYSPSDYDQYARDRRSKTRKSRAKHPTPGA